MSFLDEASDYMVSEFGETVEVVPKGEYEADDSSNPMYFSQANDGSSYQEKVRLFSSPSREMLKEYGFEEDTEAVIYNTNPDINTGDIVRYQEAEQTAEYVVRRQVTHQMGDGNYRWVYDLTRQD